MAEGAPTPRADTPRPPAGHRPPESPARPDAPVSETPARRSPATVSRATPSRGVHRRTPLAGLRSRVAETAGLNSLRRAVSRETGGRGGADAPGLWRRRRAMPPAASMSARRWISRGDLRGPVACIGPRGVTGRIASRPGIHRLNAWNSDKRPITFQSYVMICRHSLKGVMSQMDLKAWDSSQLHPSLPPSGPSPRGTGFKARPPEGAVSMSRGDSSVSISRGDSSMPLSRGRSSRARAVSRGVGMQGTAGRAWMPRAWAGLGPPPPGPPPARDALGVPAAAARRFPAVAWRRRPGDT